ncbi:MAG: sulfatase [Candidatus Hydrogenedentes bacterium]|nr:sulfatase [Candidatus Hydrogenedentota bacterium]
MLVVLDTVRARNCGAWGYDRNTTPHLDALATEGTIFTQAISPAPWTLPAHVSMFTGKYTMEHGVRGYVYRDDTGKKRIRENALADEKVTIAEHLQIGGYATAAFSANTGYLAPYFNLAQGFESYHLERIPGVDLATKALGWVREQTKPSFLFCNFMDAHRPYNLSALPDTLPEAVSEDALLLDQLREKTLTHPDSLDSALAAKVTLQYDRGIGNADAALGHLISGLKAMEIYDDTLLIVCADHGEYLGEHGLVEHSKDVFQEAVHVPLAVKAPGQSSSARVDWPVSLTQVPSTILSCAGLPARDLAPRLEKKTGTYPILSENYYSRDWDYTDPRWTGRFDRVRCALYEEPWKYIHSTDGDDGLFNLTDDPLEQRNQREHENNIYQALRGRYRAVMEELHAPASSDGGDAAPLPGPAQEELKALGYL